MRRFKRELKIQAKRFYSQLSGILVDPTVAADRTFPGSTRLEARSIQVNYCSFVLVSDKTFHFFFWHSLLAPCSKYGP